MESRAVWAQAAQEVVAAGGRTSPGLRPAVAAVMAQLGEWAGNPHPRRVAAGIVSCWYSDLEAATGFSRRAVAEAVRWLRRVGLLVGAPEVADPTNRWYRERATYRLAVPAFLRRLVARLGWGQRQRATSHEGQSKARPRVVTSKGDTENRGERPPAGVDNPPPTGHRPPLPADYLAARNRPRPTVPRWKGKR